MQNASRRKGPPAPARAVVSVLAAALAFNAPARAEIVDPGPFAKLAGWWGGQGRLRFKDGKQEEVKCRATYFVEAGGQALNQTVRCASGSGKIEVKCAVKHDAGNVTGTWQELIYNLQGNISGTVTPRGFRVSVKDTTAGLSANMEILVKDNKQIVEIQFFSETLLGLTLLLDKG